MDHAGPVRAIERVGDLRAVSEDLRDRKRPACQPSASDSPSSSSITR
jgi:hypothetical protein